MMIKNLIGLMSGTSLDGLDIVLVKFEENQGKVDYTVICSETVSYPSDLEYNIKKAHELKIDEAQILDKAIGLFFAAQVNSFIDKNNLDQNNIDAIASHGQTILHQPENGFTLQLGCGSTIAYHTGIPVVNDFRNLDVIAGGQGAPLVPIGDFELFKDKAEAFLNLGGFCNISFFYKNEIQAFDICPSNLPLNKYAAQLKAAYDKDGDFARSGTENEVLLQKLNELEYYKKSAPKSLGTEWLETNFYPLISMDLEPRTILRTITVHIANQIAATLNFHKIESVFLTGGGAKNKFLVQELQKNYSGKIIIPDSQIIDFKEALIFAFLGYCYLLNRATTIETVTGAALSLSTGVYHKPGYPTYPQP
jgi:anhydro-N-acetylmuramic acid kinase